MTPRAPLSCRQNNNSWLIRPSIVGNFIFWSEVSLTQAFVIIVQVKFPPPSQRYSSIFSTPRSSFGSPGLTSSLSTFTIPRKSSQRFWFPLWTLSGQHGCWSLWSALRDLWCSWERLGLLSLLLQRTFWGDWTKILRYVCVCKLSNNGTLRDV